MNAKELEKAREFESCYEYEHCRAQEFIENLLEHIDEQAEQIATLKAAIVDRVAEEISQRESGTNFAMGQIDFYSMAISQLARELPEIDWSDMK